MSRSSPDLPIPAGGCKLRGMEGLRAALGLEAAPGGSEDNTCSYELYPACSGALAQQSMCQCAAVSVLCAPAAPAALQAGDFCTRTTQECGACLLKCCATLL